MIEWMATALSLAGYALNVKKSRWGFVVWIAANTIWIWVGIQKDLWGLVLTMSVYTAMSVWGFISWSKGARNVVDE